MSDEIAQTRNTASDKPKANPKPNVTKKPKRNRKAKPEAWTDAQRQNWSREYYQKTFGNESEQDDLPTTNTTEDTSHNSTITVPTITEAITPTCNINWSEMVELVNDSTADMSASVKKVTDDPPTITTPTTMKDNKSLWAESCPIHSGMMTDSPTSRTM